MLVKCYVDADICCCLEIKIKTRVQHTNINFHYTTLTYS